MTQTYTRDVARFYKNFRLMETFSLQCYAMYGH